ncbi:MAG: MBL fold metallo-hydrolase [Magnetovibrionaceae bacterium]
MAFKVKFWGVRGSIACASPKHMDYGGNTSCIGVTVGDRAIILDAGTGLRGLGQELLEREIMQAHLLLTHTHWDHINGFPFFAPAYDPRRSFQIMAGHLIDKGGVREVMSTQMDNPMFPVPLEAMQANLTFEDFRAGESFQLYPDVLVRTAALNHPNDATGYRIEHMGKSVCYITDTEHVPGSPDENILELIEGSDMVIYDCTYTEDEFPAKVGWGHSTWNEGMKLCRMANVKQLAIFHHEPDHDDDFMDKLAAEAKAAWEGCFVCKEGMEVTLVGDEEEAGEPALVNQRA